MSRNDTFHGVLDSMMQTHDSKNEDYADDDNPYSNFEYAALGAGVTVDQVFAVLIGVKSERLRQLLSGKTPNFESVEDNMKDLAVYSALRLSYRLDHAEAVMVAPSSAAATMPTYVPPEGVTS